MKTETIEPTLPPACIRCGSENTKLHKKIRGRHSYYCKNCNRQFSSILPAKEQSFVHLSLVRYISLSKRLHESLQVTRNDKVIFHKENNQFYIYKADDGNNEKGMRISTASSGESLVIRSSELLTFLRNEYNIKDNEVANIEVAGNKPIGVISTAFSVWQYLFSSARS